METLDVLDLRASSLWGTALAVSVLGAVTAWALPGLLPPLPVVGATVAVSAMLLGVAVALVTDSMDRRVRGPRHVRAAGAELVAVLPTDAHPDVIGDLAVAVLDARSGDEPLRLGLAAAGPGVAGVGPWADALGIALADHGASVLVVDIASGSTTRDGLAEIALGRRRLSEVARIADGLRLARVGPGRDPEAALDGLGRLNASLPRDLEVMIVALPPMVTRGALGASRHVDHLLVVGERDTTTRVELISALDAVGRVRSPAQVVLLDGVTAGALGLVAPVEIEERPARRTDRQDYGPDEEVFTGRIPRVAVPESDPYASGEYEPYELREPDPSPPTPRSSAPTPPVVSTPIPPVAPAMPTDTGPTAPATPATPDEPSSDTPRRSEPQAPIDSLAADDRSGHAAGPADWEDTLPGGDDAPPSSPRDTWSPAVELDPTGELDPAEIDPPRGFPGSGPPIVGGRPDLAPRGVAVRQAPVAATAPPSLDEWVDDQPGPVGNVEPPAGADTADAPVEDRTPPVPPLDEWIEDTEVIAADAPTIPQATTDAEESPSFDAVEPRDVDLVLGAAAAEAALVSEAESEPWQPDDDTAQLDRQVESADPFTADRNYDEPFGSSVPTEALGLDAPGLDAPGLDEPGLDEPDPDEVASARATPSAPVVPAAPTHDELARLEARVDAELAAHAESQSAPAAPAEASAPAMPAPPQPPAPPAPPEPPVSAPPADPTGEEAADDEFFGAPRRVTFEPPTGDFDDLAEAAEDEDDLLRTTAQLAILSEDLQVRDDQ